MKLTPSEKKEAENLQLRSDDLQDILAQLPAWVVRWGTFLIFLVIVFLFVGAYFLKYPDVLTSKIVLTSEVPPAELVAQKSGVIEKIFVEDKELVKRNQVLAVIKSSGDYKDLFYLSEITDSAFSLERFLYKNISLEELNLGQVQYTFTSFKKSLEEYKSFVDLDYFQRKIVSLNQELDEYGRYKQNMEEQIEVLKKEYNITKSQYKRDSVLFTQGVISQVNFEKSESNMLSKLYALRESQTRISEAQIEISNLNQEILELELRLEESNKTLYQRLKELYNNLKADLAEWERDYLIISPYDGLVSFSKIWSINQNVIVGETVFTVVAEEAGGIIGKVKLYAFGAGKVKPGNNVIIQFDNYPYMEFGVVTGKVSNMSLVPDQDQYYIEVVLDSSELKTNFNIELNYHQNMPGVSKIVTDERSLFDRIIAPFKSALSEQRLLKSN